MSHSRSSPPASQDKLSENEKKWYNAPKQIQDQAKGLAKIFSTHPLIDRLAKEFRKNGDVKSSKVALYLAIMHHWDTFDLLHRRYYDIIYAFEPEGRYVEIDAHMGKRRSDRVRLFNCTLYNPVEKKSPVPVILKWYKSSKRDTEYEVQVYAKLRDLKCKIPWMSTSYMLWKTPVLIMEPLEPISGHDDVWEMGAQCIQQLRIVHKIGVHNDLKPGNIMKRRFTEKSERGVDRGDWEFLVIDYGGLTSEKAKDGVGYIRHVWTPKFTSQKRHEKNQVTYERHDLIELGFTIKGLLNERIEGKDTKKNKRKNPLPVRDGFIGRLFDYMHRVAEIDERNIKSKDYEDLILVLRGPRKDKERSTTINKREFISPPIRRQPTETVYDQTTVQDITRETKK